MTVEAADGTTPRHPPVRGQAAQAAPRPDPDARRQHGRRRHRPATARRLEITGVGYRAQKIGDKLQLNLGYSHPVEIVAAGAASASRSSTPIKLAVVGIDKELVGQVAARVRATRKPEPYKGKGVRYSGEVIRRKAGKAGKIGGKK